MAETVGLTCAEALRRPSAYSPQSRTSFSPQSIIIFILRPACWLNGLKPKMAETVGFEPTIRVDPVYFLSREAPSATRPRLHKVWAI